ncbi:MAG: hypothetical protein QG652_1603 [Pseudomonadota bacterium]|nr:hypothetical protein [Pseudomonadota bacterium]
MVTTQFCRVDKRSAFTLRILLCLFVMFWSTANAATITAKTGRMNIAIDESFELLFIAEGDVDKAPDFSPLKKDFDILGQSQGSNVSIINGDFRKSITFTLTLMPKRAGNLLIPAISFGKDHSQPLALSVGAVSATPDQQAELFLEVTPSHVSTWVQGQIILNVKLISAVNLRQYGISKIDTGKFDVTVETLGDAKQYQTTQGNRNFLVIEQKFALYPQQAGKLTIEPLLAEVEAVVQSRSYFDPFNTRSKTLRARSREIEINVQNMPAQFRGKHWLPASDVQLVEEWSPNPPVFKAGEPVTRTLNLFADGLTAAQLPSLMGNDINGIKQYPDQPVLNNDKSSSGIIGGRREKIALIPLHEGTFILPAVEIAWWNTKTGTTEVARLAEKTIQVLPGHATTVSGSTPNEIIPDIENSNRDLSASPALDKLSAGHPVTFIWLSGFLATGWFITGLAWWYFHHNIRPAKTVHKKKKELPDASRTAIRKACENNDAGTCKTALINWAQQNLSADINSLGGIMAKIDEPANAELIKEIQQLNSVLYSAHAVSWQGGNLWQTLHKLQTGKIMKTPSATHALEPLYK